MSAQADAGPVRRADGVRPWIAIFRQCGDKFVRKVWMRTAMARTLGEAQMSLFGEIVHAFGREAADFSWKQLGVIRRFDRLWDLVFGKLGAVQDKGLVFNQRPFNRSFRTVHIDAFAVLTRCIKKRAVNARAQVGVFEFNMSSFNGEG